jgi:hypothetical protein
MNLRRTSFQALVFWLLCVCALPVRSFAAYLTEEQLAVVRAEALPVFYTALFLRIPELQEVPVEELNELFDVQVERTTFNEVMAAFIGLRLDAKNGHLVQIYRGQNVTNCPKRVDEAFLQEFTKSFRLAISLGRFEEHYNLQYLLPALSPRIRTLLLESRKAHSSKTVKGGDVSKAEAMEMQALAVTLEQQIKASHLRKEELLKDIAGLEARQRSAEARLESVEAEMQRARDRIEQDRRHFDTFMEEQKSHIRNERALLDQQIQLSTQAINLKAEQKARELVGLREEAERALKAYKSAIKRAKSDYGKYSDSAYKEEVLIQNEILEDSEALEVAMRESPQKLKPLLAQIRRLFRENPNRDQFRVGVRLEVVDHDIKKELKKVGIFRKEEVDVHSFTVNIICSVATTSHNRSAVFSAHLSLKEGELSLDDGPDSFEFLSYLEKLSELSQFLIHEEQQFPIVQTIAKEHRKARFAENLSEQLEAYADEEIQNELKQANICAAPLLNKRIK